MQQDQQNFETQTPAVEPAPAAEQSQPALPGGRKFSKKEALKFGWQRFKQNWVIFLLYAVIIGALWGLDFGVQKVLAGQSLLLFVWMVVQIAIGLLVALGLVRVTLKVVDGQGAQFKDYFGEDFAKIVSYFAAAVLTGIATVIGLILLIVPGIIIGTRFSLFPYFIVDKNLGPVEAMSASWRATQGSVWNLFLYNLLGTVLTLLGVLALVIGAFVVGAAVTIGTGYIYRRLSASE